MNRATQDLIDAIKELDQKFDAWVSKCGSQDEVEFLLRQEMAKAVGKVNGLAYILESEATHA